MLRSAQFDDIYFSVQGGLDEARFVYLNANGLPDRWQAGTGFCILELGFGTGLNFLATWQAWRQAAVKDAKLHYISIERYPLTAGQIADVLHIWRSEIDMELSALLAAYPAITTGRHDIAVAPNVMLTLIFDDVQPALENLSEQVDAIYMDGFSPAKNPDMWTVDVCMQLGRLSRTGTTLATFTAAAAVRENLDAAGFTTRKIRGYGHKWRMIVGTFGGRA